MYAYKPSDCNDDKKIFNEWLKYFKSDTNTNTNEPKLCLDYGQYMANYPIPSAQLEPYLPNPNQMN